MVGHGGSSAGSYLDNPTSPIPSHSASIVATSTLRVNITRWYVQLSWNGNVSTDPLGSCKCSFLDVFGNKVRAIYERGKVLLLLAMLFPDAPFTTPQ